VAKVVISDPLAPEGHQLLKERGHTVVDITKMDDDARCVELANAEGWVIRSGTNVTSEWIGAAPKLKGIGRAGVGVDNVDLVAATENGIAVFNSPTGNITSAAEQAWALLFAVARRVPEADAGMKAEKWLRKELKGTELAEKTIFIVGLGRIGRMMAKRAQAFEMKCLGHDPFVTPETAKSFGVEWVEVDAGFERADIITLHTPLVSSTKELVNAERLAKCRAGAILVNAARGGLVNADDVLAALENGNLAAAGLDVWPVEPPTDWTLAKHPRVVAAPHLGASTKEAQLKAAMQACERLCDFLDTDDAGLAVNAQASIPDELQPWAELAEALAGFAAQTMPSVLEEIVIAASTGIDAKALQTHAIAGALRPSTEGAVNAINAQGLAETNGWTIATKTLDVEEKIVRIHLRGSGHEVVVEGTHTPHYGARMTSIDNYEVEVRPRGRLLLTRHEDVPGVLAHITRCLADGGVNVAAVSLARHATDGTAVAVIRVDGSIPKEARDGLRSLAAVKEAHRIRLPE
jgi:D-3-phosphoglycerate dehydrogenase